VLAAASFVARASVDGGLVDLVEGDEATMATCSTYELRCDA
jgi:hypothetical protein